jgi:hypothetical protein
MAAANITNANPPHIALTTLKNIGMSDSPHCGTGARLTKTAQSPFEKAL